MDFSSIIAFYIPDMIDDDRNPTDFIEFMDTMCNQASRE